jgi:rhamnosyltransferase
MFVAAKMLMNGWKVAYRADARTFHSHNYTIWQEFKRYFDIGVFHAREKWIRDVFGEAEKNGLGFVRYEVENLKKKPWLIPAMIMRDGMKFIGYRLGIIEASLPIAFKKKLSMNKHRNLAIFIHYNF